MKILRKYKIVIKIFSLAFLLSVQVPYFAAAQTQATTNFASCAQDFTTVPKIIDYVTCTISGSIIPLLFALALMVFFYGVVKYVIAGDGSDDREEGRWFMIYGIVGLFVMVSIWGLVALISNTFQIDTSFPPTFH